MVVIHMSMMRRLVVSPSPRNFTSGWGTSPSNPTPLRISACSETTSAHTDNGETSHDSRTPADWARGSRATSPR